MMTFAASGIDRKALHVSSSPPSALPLQVAELLPSVSESVQCCLSVPNTPSCEPPTMAELGDCEARSLLLHPLGDLLRHTLKVKPIKMHYAVSNVVLYQEAHVQLNYFKF